MVNLRMGTTPPLELRLETASPGATGADPSGTLVALGTNVVWTPPAVGWTWQTLGTPATVTVGQFLAAVLQSPTADAANYCNVNLSLPTFNDDDFGGFPSAKDFDITTPAAWAIRRRQIPILGARYADGSLVPFLAPLRASTVQSYNSGVAQPSRGVSWLQEVDAVLTGVLIGIQLAAAGLTGNVNLTLHESDDATATGAWVTLLSQSYHHRSLFQGAGWAPGQNDVHHLGINPIALKRGRRYHLHLTALASSYILIYYRLDWESASSRAAMVGALSHSRYQIPLIFHDPDQSMPIAPIIGSVRAARPVLTS